jgi:ribosome maturation factor RimP
MTNAESGRKPTFLLAHSVDRMREAIVARVTEIAKRVGVSEGIDIVDVELTGAGNRRVLRIFIDKPGGVTHADCELISKQVGTILDVEDVVPGGSYTLEVSSPGLERRLRSPADYVRFQGRKATILLREPIENQRRWEGTLVGFSAGMIILDLAHGRSVSIDLAKVQRANLKFEW